MSGGKGELQVLMSMSEYEALVKTDYMKELIDDYLTVIGSGYMYSFNMSELKKSIESYVQGEYNTDRKINFND